MNAQCRWLPPLAVVALLSGFAPAPGCAQVTRITQSEIDWGGLLASLLKNGPDFIRSPRAVSGTGVVQGGWPLVVDYKLAAAGVLELRLTVQGGPVEPLRLPGGAGERLHPVRHLPAAAGKAMGAGLFEIRAIGETGKPIGFELYGIGAGEKAVGSMAIVDVQFGPPKIHLRHDEQARFSFRAKKDFNLARAMVFSPGSGDIPSQEVWRADLDCVPSAGRLCEGAWPGRSSTGNPSKGPHQLEIKAWAGATQGGHWNSAIALDLVEVER